MQQPQDQAQHMGADSAGFGGIVRISAISQQRLGKFQKPVTKCIPDKTISRRGIFIEAIRLQRDSGVRG